MHPAYTWKTAVQYAYNLSWTVWYLHMNNIIIGDMNHNNISIDPKTGAITWIGCDSFDIHDPNTGEHFPCVLGLPELLAPEILTVGCPKSGTFTKESDNFSLAILIFRLLMDNLDPFAARVLKPDPEETPPYYNAAITGECLFFRPVPNKELPHYAPPINILPKEIVTAFERVFNYNRFTAISNAKNRTTAEEWCRALLPYATPGANAKLKCCAKNSSHVYAEHNKTCPWCERDKRYSKAKAPKGFFQKYFGTRSSLRRAPKLTDTPAKSKNKKG
jgi:DNA-binding helix-hairpin-helix protein with protein kinase domain